MKNYKRLDLQSWDMDTLQRIIDDYVDNGGMIEAETLEQFKKIKTIEITDKKYFATEKANNTRVLNAKKKIFDAVMRINKNEMKMNYSTIAEVAKVSPITVRKYLQYVTLDKPVKLSKSFYSIL